MKFRRAKEGDLVGQDKITSLGADELNATRSRIASGDPATSELIIFYGQFVRTPAIFSSEALRRMDQLIYPDKSATDHGVLSSIKSGKRPKNFIIRPGTEG